MLLGINWNIIGALATVISLAVLIGGLVASRVKKWRAEVSEESDIDQRIITTLFGKDAIPPYPAINGLIKEHGILAQLVEGLQKKVATLEDTMAIISEHVETLVERTQENGGSSIKDQLNAITDYITKQRIINTDQSDLNDKQGMLNDKKDNSGG